MAQRTCSIEGCKKPGRVTRGFCPMHYQRWRHHGDPTVVKKPNVYRSTVCLGCGEVLLSVHQARKRCEPCAVAERRRQGREAFHRKPKDEVLARMRAYRAANAEILREKQRVWTLKKLYGLSAAGYNSLYQSQNGCCAVCRKPEGNVGRSRLVVDHDHATGAIRGLLCGRCNSAIGYFADDPERLRRAAEYVEKGRTV